MPKTPNLLMGTEKEMPKQMSKPLHPTQILPRSITQRHLKGGFIMFRGDASDRQDGTTNGQMFYENDTKKLKIWNTTNEAWDEVQFS